MKCTMSPFHLFSLFVFVAHFKIPSCWRRVETLPLAMKAEVVQATGSNRSKGDKASGLDDVTDANGRLSLTVDRAPAGVEDDLNDALAAQHLEPSQQPSQDSLDAAKVWIAQEDDENRINASRLGIEEELIELCTGGDTGEGTVENEGGGTSSEVEGDVEVVGVGKSDDSQSVCRRCLRKRTYRTFFTLRRQQPQRFPWMKYHPSCRR